MADLFGDLSCLARIARYLDIGEVEAEIDLSAVMADFTSLESAVTVVVRLPQPGF